MFDALESWLRLAAERIHDQAPALTALDQAIGDGDHGINMDRGFTAIVAMLDAGVAGRRRRPRRAGGAAADGRPDPHQHRRWRLRPAVRHGLHARRRRDRRRRPGATTAAVILAAIDAAIGGIESLGKATTGEKTMLDALVPAQSRRAGRPRRRRRCPSRSPRRWPRRRGGCARDDPDARHQGPRVLSRRAQHRPPGSRRDVVGPAAARPGRCRRGRLTGSGRGACS